MKTFVSVDFEHLTPNHETACAVGMVKVINSVVVQEFYSLIKPAPDERKTVNSWITGITEEMCADAPTFAEILPVMESFVAGIPLVSHHHETEMYVLKKCCEYYGLTESPLYMPEFEDTYRITGKNLKESCQEYKIELLEHHNALEDARACAELYLKIKGEGIIKSSASGKTKSYVGKPSKENEKELCTPLDDNEVKNKNTMFFHKHIVVTGKSEYFKDREALKWKLRSWGGIITRSSTGITAKTNIVILGDENVGLNKLKDIEKYKENLTIIHAKEVAEIIASIELEEQ